MTEYSKDSGQPLAEATAFTLKTIATLKVRVVNVVIGEGGSGGALGVAVANKLCMLQHSTFSVISPEGCSSILFKTADRRVEAAEALKLTAVDLYRLKIIDEIIQAWRSSSPNLWPVIWCSC